MAELADDLIQFLADERGAQAAKIAPSDRLLEDLGMDGDDAVEFFEAYGKRFNVELTALFEHWDQHFGPEGHGPAWIAPLLIAMIACLVLERFDGPPVVIGAVVALGAVLAVWMAVKFRRREKRPHIAVTVSDLLEARDSGRWLVDYG